MKEKRFDRSSSIRSILGVPPLFFFFYDRIDRRRIGLKESARERERDYRLNRVHY